MSNEQELNDLCDAIWYLLACKCERCPAELDLSEWERLKHRDAHAWSRLAAKKAQELGWIAVHDSIAILCEDCRQNATSQPQELN
jgi:hypothetical protein